MDDIYVQPGGNRPCGHGTQVAILAAGCKTGVARNANLFVIKICDVKMKAGLVEEYSSSPAAQLRALRKVGAVVAGLEPGISVPRGKAVLVMCSGVWDPDAMRSRFGAKWEASAARIKTTLEDLDRLGVVVVLSAGNNGVSPRPQQDPNFVPRYADQYFPQSLATADSPMILVGATNNRGQLSAFTSPGRGTTPVSLYAQGQGVSTYDFLQSEPKLKAGTSYSAPIVVCPLMLKSPESVDANIVRGDWLLTRSAWTPTRVRTTPTLLPEKTQWVCASRNT